MSFVGLFKFFSCALFYPSDPVEYSFKLIAGSLRFVKGERMLRVPRPTTTKYVDTYIIFIKSIICISIDYLTDYLKTH